MVIKLFFQSSGRLKAILSFSLPALGRPASDGPFLALISITPPAPFFQQIDQGIEHHCHEAEENNTHQQPIHLKNLTRIDDQIPQPAPCRKELPDYDTHQAEPDVDLHITDDGGDRAWKHHLGKCVPLGAPKGIDQLDLLLVYPGKAGIQVQDAAEDRNRHSGRDDGSLVGAKPYDQERRKGGFGQAVEDHQVRIQDFGQLGAAPEQYRRQDTDEGGQQEAGNGLIQSAPEMQENALVFRHFPKTKGYLRGTAENERINDSVPGGKFP